MTSADIERLDKVMDGAEVGVRTAGRIRACAPYFDSLEDLVCATKGELMSAYDKSKKSLNRRSLGKTFFSEMEKLCNYVRGKLNKPVKPKEEPPKTEPVCAVRGTYKLDELKAIVAFMELCNVSEISLPHLDLFMGAMKIDSLYPTSNKENCDGK